MSEEVPYWGWWTCHKCGAEHQTLELFWWADEDRRELRLKLECGHVLSMVSK